MSAEPRIFRHEAMATWFEARIAGEEATYARQAAQAAFAVADRVEALLSRYREDSEVTRIRLLGDGESLRVSRETLDCLLVAMDVAALTVGAFDPTLGAAMDGLRAERAPRLPENLSPAPGRLEIDPDARTVTRVGGRVDLDLGAIGKGFALDRMAEELREWEVSLALLIAGGSSLLALDGPDGENGWKVGINGTHALFLRRASIGASGVAVKGSHILDPRAGGPAAFRGRAWALTPEAAWSDALSTAFMVLSWPEIEAIGRAHPEIGALRADEGGVLKWTNLPADAGFRED